MPILLPIGFIGVPVDPVPPVPPITFAFLDTDTADNDANAYTHSGLSFGTAAANRVIIAGIHGEDRATGVAVSPTTVTIGGINATKVVEKNTDEAHASIWQALVPTGTSGTVTTAWSKIQQNVGVSIFSIKTNTQAAQFTGSSSAGGNITATIPTDGYGIVINSTDTQSSLGTSSPTNFTEDYDITMDDADDSSGNSNYMGGHLTASATIHVTSTNVIQGQSTVFASWGP